MNTNEQQFGEQPTAQPQQQFAQPQQQQFTQPQQQFAQPQQQQFTQPQQQFTQPQQQFAQPQQQFLQPQQQQLNTAWIIALSGMAAVAIAFIIGELYSYSMISYFIRATGYGSFFYATSLIKLIIVIAFTALAFLLKKATAPALPIVIIVFSGIFMLTSLLGLFTVFPILMILSFVSFAGWGAVLAGAIFAIQAVSKR